MTGKRVTSRELATALRALMILLARVQLAMALEIVKSPKPQLTLLTRIRLLLTMGKKVTLQIVMPCELCPAVWAFVLLGRA